MFVLPSSVLLKGLIVIAIALPVQALEANSTCYFPDGSVHKLGTPCQPASDVSSCCESTHACLSNGLCFDTQNNHVVRLSCTDSSFASSSCPQYCTDFAASAISDVRQCDGQNLEWVCGQNVSDCTNTANTAKFTIPFGLIKDARSTSLTGVFVQIAATTSSVSSSATGKASITSGNAVTVTAAVATVTITSSAQSNNSMGTEAAIGAGIGVPLFLAFVVSFGMFLRERRLRRSEFGRPVEMPATGYVVQQLDQAYQGYQGFDNSKPPLTMGYTHELTPEGNRAELH